MTGGFVEYPLRQQDCNRIEHVISIQKTINIKFYIIVTK